MRGQYRIVSVLRKEEADRPPKCSEVGYQLYSREDAARIRFIQNSKKLWFTLNEIMELLKLRVKKNESYETVLAKTQTKLDEVEQKITGLKSMKNVLKQMTHQCQEATFTGDCPILCSFESGRER